MCSYQSHSSALLVYSQIKLTCRRSETCRSPPPYDTSSSDISDESMNAHADDLTPSASPEKADSPVTTSAKLGRLSLQQQREAGYGAGGAANDDGVRGSRTAATPLNSSLSSRHVSRPQQAAVSSPSPQDLPTQPKKRREVKRQCRSQRLAAGTRKATESNVRDPSGRCKTYTSRQDSGYATLLSGSKEGSTQWSKQTPRPKISETPREIPPSSPRNTICEQAAPEQSGVNSSLANVRFPGLVLQPDSSPISQDQLATEVKGIYAGLVMVESKCINIDAAQASDPSTVLAPEQWQALVALHRTLLYEHHDFLMATQHPSATSALKALPLRYSMPARMWKHGIHAFLEVLRHRRPHSQDYMLAFIYLAYQMMALLFETIPAFLDTWIECLGDLARYRMAIEQEREPHAQWGGVAASWYLKAADRHPEIGRLYHHLGILERPSLRKFACYGKSLTCVMPFPNARDSLKTLCNSIKEDGDAAKRFRRSTEARMCIMFALIFLKEGRDAIDAARTVAFRLVEIPDSFCWRECGVPLAITSISALLAQGSPTNPIRSAYDAFIQTQMGTSPSPSNDTPGPRPAANGLQASPDTQSDQGNMLLSTARSIMLSTLSYSLQTRNDANSIRDVLPFVHVMLCFLHSLSFIHNRYHTACTFSELEEAPWSQLACFLNSLLRIELLTQRVEQCARHGVWLRSEEGNNSSLSEDYAIRGLFWSSCTFGPGRFDNGEDEFERSIENTSTHKNRVERVLYYALRLAFVSSALGQGVVMYTLTRIAGIYLLAVRLQQQNIQGRGKRYC